MAVLPPETILPPPDADQTKVAPAGVVPEAFSCIWPLGVLHWRVGGGEITIEGTWLLAVTVTEEVAVQPPDVTVTV